MKKHLLTGPGALSEGVFVSRGNIWTTDTGNAGKPGEIGGLVARNLPGVGGSTPEGGWAAEALKQGQKGQFIYLRDIKIAPKP